MDYYIDAERAATFKLFDLKRNKTIAEVNGTQVGTQPLKLKHPPAGFPEGYPSYEIITVKGVTEVIEHRKMEPIFYLTDDPAVWSELGAGTPPLRK